MTRGDILLAGVFALQSIFIFAVNGAPTWFVVAFGLFAYLFLLSFISYARFGSPFRWQLSR